MIIEEYVNELIDSKRYELISINEGLFDKSKYKKEIKAVLDQAKGRYKFISGFFNEKINREVMKKFYEKEIKPRYSKSVCSNVLHTQYQNSDGSIRNEFTQMIGIIKNNILITFRIYFQGYGVYIYFGTYKEIDISMWDNNLIFDIINITIPDEYKYSIKSESIKITAIRKMDIIFNELKSKYSSKYNVDKNKTAIINDIIITKK